MPEIRAGYVQSRLSIQSVAFEPIGSDKNVVYITVSNPTAASRIFAVRVQTGRGIWWGQPCFATVKAGETSQVRCVFCFIGPVRNDASIELRLYEPASKAAYDFDQYFQARLFNVADLELRKTADLRNIPESDVRSGQVRQAFKSFQKLIRRRRYGEVWDSIFSEDYGAGIGSLNFQKAMSGDLPYSAFCWDRDVMLGMRPASVKSTGSLVVLSVTNGKETWQISFTRSESGWHIEWISGYDPAILQIPKGDDRKRLLLAKTKTLKTQHFEIHYFRNSTAERELSSIAQTREKGYAQIVESLGLSGLPNDRKILLILFEDMNTQFLDTGHIGLGFASEDIIGEVYNKKQRVDPYHETTHILMRPYGEPPAILNEGIAVYMSERLGGAHALRWMGGGDQTLYARVCDLKQKGEWIGIKELLTYPEIGSEESRPTISYFEAGAFVKFVIETFGKDKFLDAFKKLENSEDPKICRQNQEEFERIYGSPLQKLEEDWERAFLSKSR